MPDVAIRSPIFGRSMIAPTLELPHLAPSQREARRNAGSYITSLMERGVFFLHTGRGIGIFYLGKARGDAGAGSAKFPAFFSLFVHFIRFRRDPGRIFGILNKT